MEIYLPVNAGTAFKTFSQLELFPAWYLLSFKENENLTWITGVDGTIGAVLHWETSRPGFERGKTEIKTIKPLGNIELISESRGSNPMLTRDLFAIESVDHLSVQVIWDRELILQFPYNIFYGLNRGRNQLKEDHLLLKNRFYWNFFRQFPLTEVYPQKVGKAFREKLHLIPIGEKMEYSGQSFQNFENDTLLFMQSNPELLAKKVILFYPDIDSIDLYYYRHAITSFSKIDHFIPNYQTLDAKQVIELKYTGDFPNAIHELNQFLQLMPHAGYQFSDPLIWEWDNNKPNESLSKNHKSGQWVIYIH